MVDLLNPKMASAILSLFPYGESKVFQGFPSLLGWKSEPFLGHRPCQSHQSPLGHSALILWPYISPIIKPLGKTFPLTGTYLHFICGTQANPNSSVRPSLNHRPHLVPFLQSHSILYFFLIFMKVVTEKLCNYWVSVSLALGASFR